MIVSLSLQYTWNLIFIAWFISCHLFSIIRLPSPETVSILWCNCQLRNPTDSNDLLCPFYNPSERTAQKIQLFCCCVNLFPRKRAYPIAPQQRLYTSHLVSWHLLYCCVRILPNNGYFSGSTVSKKRCRRQLQDQRISQERNQDETWALIANYFTLIFLLG
jgi:hypothetical protein